MLVSVYLFFYAFILVQSATISNNTVKTVPPVKQLLTSQLSFPDTNLSFRSAERENIAAIRERSAKSNDSESEQHSFNVNKTRHGYERDLMVILPVMQGNLDLTSSNLQTLYTKSPITAIVDEDSKTVRQQSEIVSTARTIGKRVDTEMSTKEVDERHPYTEFLFTKPAPVKTNKSPLDYGYPESFKFIQELNELPKNHKPEWTITDVEETSKQELDSTERATKGDPFQMFESVKPLEINKLLSLKPVVVSVTDGLLDEAATKNKQESNEVPFRVKRPPQKRPTKKPQKVKPNPQKLSENDLPSLRSTAKPSLTTSSTSPTNLEPKYIAAEYSTSLSGTTKSFLPTPFNSSDNTSDHVLTVITYTSPRTPAVTTTMLTTPTTTAPTSVVPNFSWAHLTSNETTTSTELNPIKIVSQVKPSDLANLNKILGENFHTRDEPAREVSTKPTFPEEMLTGDMKNMLIALGLLKSENASVISFTTPTTTTKENYLISVFGKQEPVTPTIDPHSYVSFKKIPIHYEESRDGLPVSDDMKDLLASFGLLPKRSQVLGNSILTRISREHKLDNVDNTTEANTENIFASTKGVEKSHTDHNSTTTFDEELKLLSSNSSSAMSDIDIWPQDMRDTLENLGLILPLPFNYQPHRSDHVFQPSAHLGTLGDEQKIQKINEAIENIRKLSKSKETYKLPIEEIEKQLENVTALLKDNSTELHDATRQLNTSLSNATAIKVAETVQKIPIVDDPLDNLDFNFTSDESSISVIHFNSTDDLDLEPSTELNVVMSPPNPLSPEELQNLLEVNKNDIKRQQPNDTTTVSVSEESTTLIPADTSSTETSSTESSTRAESNNAPISDLAASFGGGDTASEDAVVSDSSTQRPNGLYFYLDWNTFLNVGEADKNPVRIRFSPRAGNARNFLPITVP